MHRAMTAARLSSRALSSPLLSSPLLSTTVLSIAILSAACGRRGAPSTPAHPERSEARSRRAFSPEATAAIVRAADATPLTTSVVITVAGELVLEHHAAGSDPDALHDTRSVGKSVTALALGAAIGQGAIAGVDEPVLAAWPTLASRPVDGLRYRDLLTMRSALACDDGDPDSPGNEDRMHQQRDWTAWVLALPRRSEPAVADEPLRYCTANAFLVGQAVARRVGMRFDAFVERALFAPLGITAHRWMTSPTDEIMTGGGLELRSRDLARLGELVLRRGQWQGRALVPAAFVDAATTIHSSAGPGRDYGYFLWHHDFTGPCGPQPAWFMAGNGGNLVAVFADLAAVVVITRTAYNQRGTAEQTIALVEGAILPALVRCPAE